jgi:[acyl-carrier-protein] S-malonyltransferase
LEGLGFTHYVEMGPGKVLSGLGKRIVKQGSFLNVETAADMKAVEKILEEAVPCN